MRWVLVFLLDLAIPVIKPLHNHIIMTTPLTVALIALIVGLYLANRKEFPVPDPQTGAIVITGASSGIGKDAALTLDALG